MKWSYCTRILLISAAVLICNSSNADTLQGLVVGVSDGDTVTVLDTSNTQWKIRLMGIDAPEKKQDFGQKSKQSLSNIIYNKQVTVEYNKKDKFGRTIGKLTVDGVDANLEQVKLGMAWHYKHYQREQSESDRIAYAEAEKKAMQDRIGLWQDDKPAPPWDWRHQQKIRK